MRPAAASMLVLAALAASIGCVEAQQRVRPDASPRIDPAELAALLDSVLPAAMAERHIPGAVFVLVQDGRVVLSKGFGFADVERRRPVSPDSTIFMIGSISKVFTATAVMQLADRGRLDLRADVNRYLRRVRVPDAFGAPITAHHLLTHTGGLDELPGRLVREDTAPVLPLDRFLAGRLVRVRPPGELTVYSSYGAALAGLLVEEVSGQPFERYLACNVWEPLGMHRTYVTVPGWLERDRAVGYEYADDRVQRVGYERYHTPPAGSISSTAADMARYMIAQLRGGEIGGARILSVEGTAMMQRQHETAHPRLPGFAYGFQRSTTNGQAIVEHGGDVAGFSSLMVLLPEHGTGFFIAGHREGSDLRSVVRRRILDRWFPDTRPVVVPRPDPAAAVRMRRFAGTYRASPYCRTCPPDPERFQDFEVTANADGTLSLWDDRWVEVEPLYFRSADGTRRIGFKEDAQGRVMAITAGSWMVLEKVQ